jgi:hypothetical protein
MSKARPPCILRLSTGRKRSSRLAPAPELPIPFSKQTRLVRQAHFQVSYTLSTATLQALVEAGTYMEGFDAEVCIWSDLRPQTSPV